MKIFLLSFFIFYISCIYSQNLTQRVIQDFNDEWKFISGDPQNAESLSFNDSAWTKIFLPHDWSIGGEFNEKNPSGGSGAFLPCGTGWYRKSFELSDKWSDKKIFIQFDGVYMNSKVWINGHFLGLYPYGYSTFQYDLSPFLKFGKNQSNVICVRVDNSLQPSSRWYTGSGIYRKVSLIATNKLHFERFGVSVHYSKVGKEKAIVNIDYKIKSNKFKETDFYWWRKLPQENKRVSKFVKLTTKIYNEKGKMVKDTSTNFEIQDYSSVTTQQKLSINSPDLWTHNSPKLYKVYSSISIQDTLIDDQITNIGIREINFSSDMGMKVNGEKVILKGVCIHHDAGSLGSAVPSGVWENRLKQLKSMGCNAIRPSHCPFAPDFLDLCDKMGFFVMDEAFDEWQQGLEWDYSEDGYGKIEYGYNKYFNQWAETDLRNMILRDRNHPSVIMYSIGNEIQEQRRPFGVETARKLVNICHQLDPTRLVTVASDFSYEANIVGFLDAVDIAGYNYVDRFAGDKMYQIDKEKYPNRLFLGTETYYKLSNWLGVRDFNYVIGEFLWVAYDYLGEAGEWPKKGWDAGLIDLSGKARPEFYLRKAYWSADPTVTIAVENTELAASDWHPRNVSSHWNWENDSRDSLPVYIYSNCDRVEVFLNNKIIYKTNIHKDKYFDNFKLPYAKGELKALGYKGDKKVCQHILKTAALPASINLSANKKSIAMNHDEVVIVGVEIQDKNGVTVPTADDLLKVNVSGSGQLLGIDSGDQLSHEKYKSDTRKAFKGRCMLTVGYTSGTENIVISVKDEKLLLTKELIVKVNK